MYYGYKDMNETIAEFRALIEQWREAYRWAVVSYVALRSSEAEGHNLLVGHLGLEVTLDEQFRSATPQHMESTHVVAHREVFAVQEQLDSLLEALAEGRLETADDSCALRPENDRFDHHFRPHFPYSRSDGPRTPTLYVRGINRWNLMQHLGLESDSIDWELKATDTPFDSLSELLIYYGLETSDGTLITINAGTPAVIRADSELINGMAYMRCAVADNLSLDKLKIGYKIVSQGATDRGASRGTDLTWRNEGEIRIGELVLPVGDAPAVQGFLSYAGVALHQWWVTDATRAFNSRYAAYQSIDPQLSTLRDYLATESKKPGEDFEVGVAALLTILGFSVLHLGKRAARLQEGPDMLATTPQGNMAIVECTIGHLTNNDKLSKLTLRCNSIREKVNGSGHGHLIVQAVIVTALSRQDISADLPEAAKRGVAVFTKEDLVTLLDSQALLPPDADKLLRETVEQLPRPSLGDSWE